MPSPNQGGGAWLAATHDFVVIGTPWSFTITIRVCPHRVSNVGNLRGGCPLSVLGSRERVWFRTADLSYVAQSAYRDCCVCVLWYVG